MPQEGFIAKLTQLLALYVVYVFLSGWTFFDFYYHQFGVDPRSFDLPVQETLVKGFTILFTSGTWLWPLYAAMLMVPLLVDGSAALRDRLWVRPVLGLFMLGVLLGVYFISRNAGVSEAMKDQGSSGRLTPVTFSLKACVERREKKTELTQGTALKTKKETAAKPENCDYNGEILIFRNGTYYMYKVVPLRQPLPQKGLAVLVYRAEDLINVNLAGQLPNQGDTN
jgi:hypothetical protein